MSIGCELLFSAPKYTQVKLASDGCSVFYIRTDMRTKILCRYDLDSKTEKEISKIADRMRLFNVLETDNFYYITEENGCLNTLYINVRNQQHKIIFEGSNIKVLNYSFEKKTLIFAVSRSKSSVYDLYKWDYSTSTYHKIYTNNENAFKWQFDANNEIKVKYIDVDDHIELYFHYKLWKKIREYSYSDYWQSYVVAWDEEWIYIKERGEADTFSLIKMQYCKLTEYEVVYRSKFDIEDVIVIDNKIIAISYCAYRKKWKVLDNTFRYDFEIITDSSLGDLKEIAYVKQQDVFLLTYTIDQDVKRYYIYYRGKKEMSLLFKSRDCYWAKQLSPQIGFTYLTRDKIFINGYISTKDENNHTLVVKIHGGPTQRVTWGYNSITQFFATRGCICVEPNYRGSYGYGRKFEDLLNIEMGNKVTDDIYECIDYVKTKYEVASVYLFGWSAGGYIAMMTAINHDIKLLNGVVAISAPLDMEQIISNSEKQGIQKDKLAYIKFGDPVKDKESLKRQSVRTYNLDFPLLYAYGKKDSLMNNHTVDWLKEQNMCRLLEYDDSHAIQNPHNRIALFRQIEKFMNLQLS